MTHKRKRSRVVNQRCRVRQRPTDYSLAEKSPYWEVYDSHGNEIDNFEANGFGGTDNSEDEEDPVRKAQQAAVEAAFDDLSPKQKVVLDAIMNGGYISLEELADNLGMSRRSFRTHLARAKAKIKSAYKKRRRK